MKETLGVPRNKTTSVIPIPSFSLILFQMPTDGILLEHYQELREEGGECKKIDLKKKKIHKSTVKKNLDQ
jgi:tricorn protease-like protein